MKKSRHHDHNEHKGASAVQQERSFLSEDESVMGRYDTLDPEEDEAFITKLMHGFDQMDHAIQKHDPPALHELEEFVFDHQHKLRTRSILEWVSFLIIAMIVIGGNILLAVSSTLVFAVVQGAVFLGVIGFAIWSFQKSKKKVKSGRV